MDDNNEVLVPGAREAARDRVPPEALSDAVAAAAAGGPAVASEAVVPVGWCVVAASAACWA